MRILLMCVALAGCAPPVDRTSYVDRDLRVDAITTVNSCTLHRVEYRGQIGYLTTLNGHGSCSFVLAPTTEVK